LLLNSAAAQPPISPTWQNGAATSAWLLLTPVHELDEHASPFSAIFECPHVRECQRMLPPHLFHEQYQRLPLVAIHQFETRALSKLPDLPEGLRLFPPQLGEQRVGEHQ
jgi:hypothetical protein